MSRNTILIVDDDPNICELLRLYLRDEVYELAFAHDGSAGLTILDILAALNGV